MNFTSCIRSEQVSTLQLHSTGKAPALGSEMPEKHLMHIPSCSGINNKHTCTAKIFA